MSDIMLEPVSNTVDTDLNTYLMSTYLGDATQPVNVTGFSLNIKPATPSPLPLEYYLTSGANVYDFGQVSLSDFNASSSPIDGNGFKWFVFDSVDVVINGIGYLDTLVSGSYLDITLQTGSVGQWIVQTGTVTSNTFEVNAVPVPEPHEWILTVVSILFAGVTKCFKRQLC